MSEYKIGKYVDIKHRGRLFLVKMDKDIGKKRVSKDCVYLNDETCKHFKIVSIEDGFIEVKKGDMIFWLWKDSFIPSKIKNIQKLINKYKDK